MARRRDVIELELDLTSSRLKDLEQEIDDKERAIARLEERELELQDELSTTAKIDECYGVNEVRHGL